MPADRRWLAPAILSILLAIAIGCSDNGPSGSSPVTTVPTTTTTTQPAATVLVEADKLIPRTQVYFVDVTTPASGQVDVTIDYGSASNVVNMWLTTSQCSFILFDRDSCDYWVKSLGGPKPRTMSAVNVPAGTYTLFIANDGPGDDTVHFRVSLRR